MAKNPERQLPKRFTLHSNSVVKSENTIVEFDLNLPFDFETYALYTDYGTYAMAAVELNVPPVRCPLCSSVSVAIRFMGGNGMIYTAVSCYACNMTAFDYVERDKWSEIVKHIPNGLDILGLMDTDFDFHMVGEDADTRH